MRFLIAPDKFKGCLTAGEVAEAVSAGVVDAGGEAQIVPLADGGDGSVDAALAAGFERKDAQVRGPLGAWHETYFAMDGITAVVEVASACGVSLLAPDELQPMRASSAGLGDVILAATEHGAERIVIGLGGSASTDGGLGLLMALGAQTYDADGCPVSGDGNGLLALARLDASSAVALPELVVACDVDAPLFGPNGAAHVFAPQKGANTDQVAQLDDALRQMAELTGRPDLAEHPGAGAAGGLGFALLLLGASIQPGAEYFLNLLGFDDAVQNADAVITGEGRFDDQTLMGKLPLAVARRSQGKPVHLVCGQDTSTDSDAAAEAFASVTALSQLTDRDTSADPALTQTLLRDVGRHLTTTPPTAQR